METSYNENSSVQKVQDSPGVALLRQYSPDVQGREVVVCDYGAATGGNTKQPVQAIVNKSSSSSVKLFYEDVPANAWDVAEAAVEELKSELNVPLTCQMVKRSFYESLTSEGVANVDVGFCFVAVHWVSRIPSRPGTAAAFVANQLPRGHPIREEWRKVAAQDLAAFFMHRAAELKSSGILVCAVPGCTDDDDFEAREAWPLFRKVLDDIVEAKELQREEADYITTAEYWRTPEDLSEVLKDKEVAQAWDVLHQEDVPRVLPCPHSSHLPPNASPKDLCQCGDKLVGVFKAFLHSSVTESLEAAGKSKQDAEAAADIFWSKVSGIARQRPTAVNLHTVMHYFVLRRR